MLKAIIIDDEEKSRKLLRNLLETYCQNLKVLKLADSVQAGLKAIHDLQPNLVFLDVVMPNENGFELVRQLDDFNGEIIFTTAYDQYAIKAIRVCALDYLLKPIDVEELQHAVERARQKIQEIANSPTDTRLKAFIENYRAEEQSKKIGFPTQNGVNFYPISKICYCKAEGNYTTIHLEGNKKMELISKTLKEFEELLSEFNFIRTHRSFLINLNHLKEYRRSHPAQTSEGEGGCIVLSNNIEVPVSRDKRKLLLDRIGAPF